MERKNNNIPWLMIEWYAHRNGEDELLDAALQEQPAFSRTMLSAAAGGIVILGCSAVCLLCGNDPAGECIQQFRG